MRKSKIQRFDKYLNDNNTFCLEHNPETGMSYMQVFNTPSGGYGRTRLYNSEEVFDFIKVLEGVGHSMREHEMAEEAEKGKKGE